MSDYDDGDHDGVLDEIERRTRARTSKCVASKCPTEACEQYIVRKVCGPCDYSEEQEDGTLFCIGKIKTVEPDEEGCKISTPIYCPSCGRLIPE